MTSVAPAAPLIDDFLPHADICECHEILVRAPATAVMDVAEHFDLQSLPVVRAIFWLRSKLLGAAPPAPDLFGKGLVASTMAQGWGELSRGPGRALVMGAVTQPWKADVIFTAIAAEHFAGYAEPGRVKIVWTIETEPLGPSLTRLRTETRAVATDAAAQRQFLRYWRWARFGIVLIRWLLLPAVKREAERRALSGLAVAQ